MNDVQMTGAARIDPAAPGAELKPARWSLRAPKLARMDRLCALALCAADAAILDAGVDPAGWDGDRTAIVVGTAFGCHATNEDYFRGLAGEGPSPRLFAYTLPSSPAGEISIHFAARGPADTVAVGRHSGLEALERAFRLCASGRADRAIAVAADVATASLAGLGYRVREAAAAIFVERGDLARARNARLLGQIAGAATLHRGNAQEALAAAAALAAREGSINVTPAIVASPEGDDAVAPLAALCDSFRSDGNRLRIAAAADREGGATALLVVPPVTI
jgi:3-oxoacyl-[acyl-carrier-protein] synthase II